MEVFVPSVDGILQLQGNTEQRHLKVDRQCKFKYSYLRIANEQASFTATFKTLAKTPNEI
jgi:hypothetical protein